MWKFLKIFRILCCLLGGVIMVNAEGSSSSSSPSTPTPVTLLPLPSEAYSEGECIAPQVVNVDINWIIQQRMFYIPIASQFALHRYAETLLSRPPVSEQEINTMCIEVLASQSGPALNLTNVGFDDREFRQSCTPGSEPGKINCFAAGSSAGVNPSKTRATENFVVAWDGRSYMIIVRCVDGFFRDFSVFSTRPSVSHDVYNSVLNVTRHLGFDERRIQTSTYDNCIRTSTGFNSNLKLKHKSGPFTHSVLAAPYSNLKPTAIVHNHPVVKVVTTQHHDHSDEHNHEHHGHGHQKQQNIRPPPPHHSSHEQIVPVPHKNYGESIAIGGGGGDHHISQGHGQQLYPQHQHQPQHPYNNNHNNNIHHEGHGFQFGPQGGGGFGGFQNGPERFPGGGGGFPSFGSGGFPPGQIF